MARPSRKDEILQAALACFTEHGVDVTTIEMIRDRSGASIGSLYHHFGNKERIIAALYLAGTAQYADLLQRGFASAASAEACVKLLVTSYIDWVAANPDWARFILHSRGRVEAGRQHVLEQAVGLAIGPDHHHVRRHLRVSVQGRDEPVAGDHRLPFAAV